MHEQKLYFNSIADIIQTIVLCFDMVYSLIRPLHEQYVDEIIVRVFSLRSIGWSKRFKDFLNIEKSFLSENDILEWAY